MITAIKKQFKVAYDDGLIMLLLLLGVAVFGKILFQVMVHFDADTTEHFALGAMLAGILGVLYHVFYVCAQLTLYFNVQISFGGTRKHFFVSQLVWNLFTGTAAWIVVLMISLIENAVNQAIYPTWAMEMDITVFIIRWGFLFVAASTLLGLLFGALGMKFGKIAFWIGWVFWMFICIGGPNIGEAMEDAPNSFYGRVGHLIGDIFSAIPGNVWITAGVIAAIAVLTGTWSILRKQQVTA